jgi:hypothetical protein
MVPPRPTPAATIAIFPVAVNEARHEALVAVVVGGLLLRPLNEPIVTIGAGRFRIAACNSLNFGTGYAQQTNLSLNGTSINNAAYSPSSGFGFAPYKLGRRLLEVSAQFTFQLPQYGGGFVGKPPPAAPSRTAGPICAH